MLSLEEAQSRAQDLVSAARKAGADASDAIYACNASTNVSVRLGALEDVERSEGEEIGLRVFIGSRSASISASDMNPATLATLVDRAVAMAREAPEDPYAGLAPEDRLMKKRPPALDLTDSEEPEPALLRERALMAEEAARSVPGVTNSEGGGASNGRSQVALATSHGFAGAYAGTSHSTWASVLAGAGADMQRDHASHSVRHLEDLDDAEAIGVRAGQRAVARLNPVKVDSGVMPVIFDPRIGSSLLGHLIGGMVGPAIARRSSFLLESLGEALFDAGVTIVDDPLLVRGLRSRPFDGEGLPVARRALIDRGVLTGWLMDSASARQLGLEPTGHASRGGSGAPGASITNVHMEAGSISPGDLMADVKRGLYVTELIGMGVNGVTGDYSRGAAGFLIENGAVAHAVSEITIASNLKAMFRSLVPANDLHFRYAMNVPTLRVDGMTVAGGDVSLRAVVSAVADAADHALTLWAGGETRVRQWEKVPGHPVCEADLDVDAMLRARLSTIAPDAGWLSEETADTVHRLGVPRVWVVDPIDGTRDYLRGRRGWAVSVALVEDGAVRLGILAAPARNELWIAQAGKGATRNGVGLRAGGRTALAGARVPAEQLPRIDRDLVTVEKPNSIALRMAMVAADEADLVATVRWGNEWDVAAAAIICQEAGATVTDALGDMLAFNRPQPVAFGLLCAAPGIHAAATERLAPRAREILGGG